MIQTINELSTYWDALENTMNIYVSEFSKEESEIDWNAIPINIPILVRDSIKEPWMERYFAGYFKGMVHTYKGMPTSCTYDCIMPWRYAKLKTTEE